MCLKIWCLSLILNEFPTGFSPLLSEAVHGYPIESVFFVMAPTDQSDDMPVDYTTFEIRLWVRVEYA